MHKEQTSCFHSFGDSAVLTIPSGFLSGTEGRRCDNGSEKDKVLSVKCNFFGDRFSDLPQRTLVFFFVLPFSLEDKP